MNMEIETIVKVINEGIATKGAISKEVGMTMRELTKQIQEAGYEWDNKEKEYIMIKNDGNNEIKNESEEKSIMNLNQDKIKNESKIEINNESKNEIKNQIYDESNEIDDILNSIGNKKRKTVPVTTQIEIEISEALNQFGEDNGRGSKQELINKLLRMALKKSGHL